MSHFEAKMHRIVFAASVRPFASLFVCPFVSYMEFDSTTYFLIYEKYARECRPTIRRISCT